MSESLTVSPLYVERSRQISWVVQHDIVKRGLTFEQSVEELSRFLGIDPESVRLSISVVNELDRGGELVTVEEEEPV